MLHKLCAIVNIKWPTTTSSVRPSAMLCHAMLTPYANSTLYVMLMLILIQTRPLWLQSLHHWGYLKMAVPWCNNISLPPSPLELRKLNNIFYFITKVKMVDAAQEGCGRDGKGNIGFCGRSLRKCLGCLPSPTSAEHFECGEQRLEWTHVLYELWEQCVGRNWNIIIFMNI